MDRQQAAICIAKMNKYSRQIETYIEANTPLDFKTIAPEIAKVGSWGEAIIDYLHKNPSFGATRDICNIHDPGRINEYLKSAKRLKADIKIYLKELVGTITKLKDYAEKYQKQYRKGPYEKLIEELAYKEAKDVFLRIQKAGFIDDDFKLKKSTKKIQTFVLGWSIINLLKLPKRKSWALIERQWECTRLSGVTLPEQKTKDIDKVKAIFPELDYSDMFPGPADKQFEVNCGEDVLMDVFLTLVTHGFISKRTKFENFRTIFTICKAENLKPVDWIGSVRYLTYFVHYAFGKTNDKYLERTRFCFTLKGNPLNRGTIKSTTSLSVRQDDGSETLVGLKQTALKLAVTGESDN